MKKLAKLQINPEKVINNQGLLSLKGGGAWLWTCDCWVYEGGQWTPEHYCSAYVETQADAIVSCEEQLAAPHWADCDVCWSY